MTDTVIKGSGNSRSLKTVPNALTMYPTHEAMLQAMINGTFPIDLGPLNAAGINTRGNDLNKSTLLKDSTAALYGLGADAVPDDVLGLKFSRIETGQYKGDEQRPTASNPKSLFFSFRPKIIFIVRNGEILPSFCYGSNSYNSFGEYIQIFTDGYESGRGLIARNQSGIVNVRYEIQDDRVIWFASTSTANYGTDKLTMNGPYKYDYFVFG